MHQDFNLSLLVFQEFPQVIIDDTNKHKNQPLNATKAHNSHLN